MAKIVFFCNVQSPDLLSTVEFYRQDIQTLEQLGHDVVLCTKWREIPWHFDALYVWWWTHAWWPALIAKFRRRPCLVTGVFNFRCPEWQDGRDYFRRPAWQRWLLRRALRDCSRNVFISQHEQTQCATHFQITHSDCLPLALADKYLQGPGSRRERAILNLAWCQRSNLVRKGVPELISAVSILKQRGIRVPLYLAGHAGDGKPFLESLVKEHGLEDSVHLLGEISSQRKLELLRSCQIYAQPSQYEGFGLAMAEAMGSGAAIVTCDVGAVREVVGDAGLYVTAGDANELADAIARLLEDEEERQRLQTKAQQRAIQSFSMDVKLERMAQILNSEGVFIPDVVSGDPAADQDFSELTTGTALSATSRSQEAA